MHTRPIKQPIPLLVLMCLCAPFALAQASDIGRLDPQVPPGWTDGSGGSISILAELLWLSETVVAWDEDWTLESDIDASETIDWNDGKGFSPIGDSPSGFGVRQEIPFTGSFDGQGFEIINLFIARPDEPYVGMFGQLTGGSILNLSLAGSHVEGFRYVGGLIGYADFDAIIAGCHLSGDVSANETVGGLIGQIYQNVAVSSCSSNGTVTGVLWVGGLAGDNYSHSAITNCYSTCTISGTDYLGGLVGSSRWFSNIDFSFSIGNTSGSAFIGGLVGFNEDSAVNNCFSASASIGQDRVGGLVGMNLISENIQAGVYYSYATGEVSGNLFVGGLIGQSYSFVVDCYFDVETTGTLTGIGNPDSGQIATGLATQDFADGSNFLNWDFENTWTILIHGQISPALRPYLNWQIVEYYTLTFVAGAGGSIQGETTQLATPGSNSVPVTAVSDEGYIFVEWQDGQGGTYSVEETLVVLDVAESETFSAVFESDISAIGDDTTSGTIVGTRLLANWPNPFGSQTVLRFNLAAAGPMELAIFDVRGRKVRTLQSGGMAAGPHEARWDGTDDQGNTVAAGVYWSRLEAAGGIATRKIIRVR